jgi:hypothetical protein
MITKLSYKGTDNNGAVITIWTRPEFLYKIELSPFLLFGPVKDTPYAEAPEVPY